MEQVLLIASGTRKSQKADVLSRSLKSLRVALAGTQLTVSLSRNDPSKPYVGYAGGIEVTSDGKLL